MCAIAGAAGRDAADSVKKMLEVMKHRGPDGSGIFLNNDISIGNVLLKITGEKSQPISNGSALTYNGEIYNFRAIAKELEITTDSDSETLFELILSKGVENAVQYLDGDYAFAYYDAGKLFLVRDTAGVKPLFYASGEMFAFASEKKALAAAAMKEPRVLRPGHMLIYSAGNIFEKKVSSFREGKLINDEKQASPMLFDVIREAVKKRYYKPCAIAFSGGLDSSLVAALAENPELYSVAMAHSHDIKQTMEAAKSLGLADKLHLHELTMDEVESSLPPVMKAVESFDPLKVSIAMPLYFASKDAGRDGIRVILSGQGADELFAGYKRYESIDFHELGTTLKKDLEDIADNNLERDDAATMANSVELRVPYLDRKVVELALRISPELKIRNGIRKYILRLAAKEVLPDALIWKEKKAAQYSSGIYSAMEKIARQKGFTEKQGLRDYLRETFLKWNDVPPFQNSHP